MTRVIAIIPARMGSSRFPGKPLAPILGRPMLEHVYRRTVACKQIDEAIVATCDDAIAQAAISFGARTVMTSPEHERASDRVAEASAADPADIVVMVQGDEPMIQPGMIAAALTPMLADPSIPCVNLVSPIRSEKELLDRNTIKVVMSRRGAALYFSREPVPTSSNHGFTEGIWHKQVCVIPFRRDALQLFASLPQGPLEVAESIDMLRFLENGVSVRTVHTEARTHAVDTPADLELVRSLLACDGRWTLND